MLEVRKQKSVDNSHILTEISSYYIHITPKITVLKSCLSIHSQEAAAEGITLFSETFAIFGSSGCAHANSHLEVFHVITEGFTLIDDNMNQHAPFKLPVACVLMLK